MFVDLILNSVNMSYQCNGINGSTKLTLSSFYLSEPENGRLYDCNFYLTEYLKKETQLRVIRLESVIMSIPSYLAPQYLQGTFECGGVSGSFDNTHTGLEHLSGIYLDPSVMLNELDKYTHIDRILFRLLQFLKEKGGCGGDEVRFDFIDDVDDHYDYNQYHAGTITDNVLLDLSLPANLQHLDVIRDFVMKRNYCLTITCSGWDPLVLNGPILKILGFKIEGDDATLTIDDQGVLTRLNLFGPLYYTIETNLVNSHINNVSTHAVSTSSLLRVIPFENKQPGQLSVFERMNDGGCLQVDDPTIDLVTLTFRDQQGDYLLSLYNFVVTLVLDYVSLPKPEKEEFFSLDKIRRATADKVRDQLTKRLKTG